MIHERVIDLTLTLDSKVAKFKREISKSIPPDGWNASMLHIYSHTGTHMDCPYHFGVSDITIDRISPERFMADGILVRMDDVKPGMHIEKNLLDGYKPVDLKDKAILFHTGWSKYYHDPEMYRNRLPKISRELANYLVECNVSIIGVEPPSVSDVNNIDELAGVHRILLEGNVIIVEGLANLEGLTGSPFRFIALPLKIAGGDGAPVRAIAIEQVNS